MVLKQIEIAAASGSEEDVEVAMELVGRIELEEAGNRRALFAKSQETLEIILREWYVGTLPLASFANPSFVGDPHLWPSTRPVAVQIFDREYNPA